MRHDLEPVERNAAAPSVVPSAEPASEDQWAQMLAVEAVLGTLARGRGVDEQAVCEWITAALGQHPESEEMVNRALSFARRMLYGPLPLGS